MDTATAMGATETARAIEAHRLRQREAFTAHHGYGPGAYNPWTDSLGWLTDDPVPEDCRVPEYTTHASDYRGR